MTINTINSHFFINSDRTHTLIGTIKKFKLARSQASADLNKLLLFKTEQKKKYGYLF